MSTNGTKRFFITFIGLAVTISVLYHVQILNGFKTLAGDRFDVLIEDSILLHWYNFFAGNSEWNVVNYFYPYANTLGYNDAYFLYGLIFSIFHFIGFDIFLSSEFVNISLRALGFLSFHYLCFRCLKVPFFIALCGAVIFTLGNGLAYQAAHAQLLSLAFAPILTILFFHYLRNIFCNENLLKSIIFGSLGAAFYSAWLFTAFYMAWFYAFFLLIMLSVFIIYCVISNRPFLRNNLKKINFVSLIVPLLVFIITVTPFLLVYLPKIKETGGQNLAEVYIYAPVFGNIFDPGSGNLVFGKLSDIIFGDYFSINRSGEFRVGFPPFALLVVLFTLLLPVKIFNKSSGIILLKIAKYISLCIIISLLIAVKFNDFTLWEYVWKFIPGAKGMRVTVRYLLFLIFPLSVVITLFIACLNISALNKSFIALLAFVLIFEQVNIDPSQNLDRNAHNKFLTSIPKPPSSCRAFFVTGQREGEFPMPPLSAVFDLYPQNVDAMLISEHFSIRTINGFSTFNPPDWAFQITPYDTYLNRVFDYADKHDITVGMCELDLTTLTWNEDVLRYKERLIKIMPNDLKIDLVEQPKLSDNGDSWVLKIKVVNHSQHAIGENTFIPVNLGVRELNSDGTIKKQDFMRVPIPHISRDRPEVIVTINIPLQMLTTTKIDILPVRDPIAWLDRIGLKPIVVNL